MSFAEYLAAHGQLPVLEALQHLTPGESTSDALHRTATAWFHRYTMTGGMPAVVATDVRQNDAAAIRELQLDLLATYRADFSKYATRMDPAILDSTLATVALSVGRKFVYSRVGDGIRHQQAKSALEHLVHGRVCHLIPHTAGNGLPLGAEAKPNMRKVLLGDVGLLHALLRTPASNVHPRYSKLSDAMRGALSEQMAGQQLRLLGPHRGNGPQLFYWQRDGGRAGEIDFLVQSQMAVVPVEVKSGAVGAMKSLHQFMFEKALGFAVRIDSNPASDTPVRLKTSQGNPVSYHLRSIPHYLTGFSQFFEPP